MPLALPSAVPPKYSASTQINSVAHTHNLGSSRPSWPSRPLLHSSSPFPSSSRQAAVRGGCLRAHSHLIGTPRQQARKPFFTSLFRFSPQQQQTSTAHSSKSSQEQDVVDGDEKSSSKGGGAATQEREGHRQHFHLIEHAYEHAADATASSDQEDEQELGEHQGHHTYNTHSSTELDEGEGHSRGQQEGAGPAPPGSHYFQDVDGSPAGSSFSTYSFAKSNYPVLRLEPNGRTRRFYVRRRDLLREHKLQPRDLRRIDPAIDFTKTSPSITVKENALLLCLGGVRAIVTAEKALLFEPNSPATNRFLETMVPHLESKAEQREFGSISKGGTLVPASDLARESALVQASHSEYMARFQFKNKPGSVRMPPFELEMLEGALIVATGFLDNELSRVSKRVQKLLTKLPHDINPKGLEELRKVKTALVEAEDRTDTLRNMLEELMDDEDELREMNLLSRPRREERRKQRERERLERELERAREIKEELEDRLEEDEQGPYFLQGADPSGPGNNPANRNSSSKPGGRSEASSMGVQLAPTYYVDPSGKGYASWTGGAVPSWDQPLPSMPPLNSSKQHGSSSGSSKGERQERLSELRSKFDRERAALLNSTDLKSISMSRSTTDSSNRRHHQHHQSSRNSSHTMSSRDKSATREREKKERELERAERLERLRLVRSGGSEADEDWINRLEAQLEGSEEDIMEAQEALEEMMEQEEEEYEVEEVEDLMEYYLQRASAAQSEAERLLAGARDLEESISVSLSARRFEVNRLELTLSIASFAAAIGAVIAGIFGMNMRSTMENSIIGFWGVAGLICLGCTFLFFAVLRYTRRKRIL